MDGINNVNLCTCAVITSQYIVANLGTDNDHMELRAYLVPVIKYINFLFLAI